MSARAGKGKVVSWEDTQTNLAGTYNVYEAARQELVSKGAGLAFPIHAGVPVMVIDEARQLDD